MHSRLTLLVLIAAVTVTPQERFGDEHDGRLRGFTKSPAEHIMNEYPELIEVRSIHGRITEVAAGSAVPRALFEIRGENPDGKVRGVTADQDGRFRMRSIAQGEYMFKVTRDGFQSVFGHIRVSSKAKADAEIGIVLKQGV
jgi:Carboxypeptidase regulatory-like domain